MKDTILLLSQVSKEFGDGNKQIRVLKDIHLKVKRGEFIALVGPSGSGKSTLLSIIGALLTPSAGEIILDNEALHNMGRKQLNRIRANKVGFIFQSSNLIPYLNVYEQLSFMSEISSINKKIAHKNIMKLLMDLGLTEQSKHYPKTLSGGEKQRVAIARAFISDPSIILADEPTASLDSKRGRQVVEMISQEVKARNKTAIMVTHDERMLDLCDRVYYMEDGQLYEK